MKTFIMCLFLCACSPVVSDVEMDASPAKPDLALPDDVFDDPPKAGFLPWWYFALQCQWDACDGPPNIINYLSDPVNQ